ncbi:hypothetical protein AC1031_009187 [Aphanomyces cochlioides]|nr:hypothetical protein AC1031_009187 [Aphanomyces cochlioides]
MCFTSILLVIAPLASATTSWVTVNGYWFSPAGGRTSTVNATSVLQCSEIAAKAGLSFANYNSYAKSCYAFEKSNSYLQDTSYVTGIAKYDSSDFSCSGNVDFKSTSFRLVSQDRLGFKECMAKCAAASTAQNTKNLCDGITWEGVGSNNLGTCNLKYFGDRSFNTKTAKGLIACKYVR